MVDTRTAIGSIVDDETLQAFQAHLRGPLLRPGDDGYDTARTVWNAMIDRRPALIAQPVGAADVIAAVSFAREQGLPLSVKGGGHNVAGKAVCQDGLMLDMSRMKGIRVDPYDRTVRAEAGVLWGELDRETHAFGLAAPGGYISTTGIAGLTLGGGQSWIGSKYGFSIDNLLSVDVVTADGLLRHASGTENDDLFWAMRGAGANFGVVTSFEYRLHPVSTVLGGMVVHPFEKAREVLRFFRDYSAALPDELTIFGGILTGPDGNQIVAIAACYAGDLDEGERVLAPLRLFGPPLADTIAPVPFPVHQTMLDAGFPHGRHNYWKTSLTSTISDAAIDTIVDFAGRTPSPFSATAIGEWHGAYARVGNHDTAYSHRDKQYDVLIVASWSDPDDTEPNIQWTREFFDALQPHVSAGVYVNDLSEEGPERARAAYGENYERLAALKTKYDPTNLFRVNQNIPPRG